MSVFDDPREMARGTSADVPGRVPVSSLVGAHRHAAPVGRSLLEVAEPCALHRAAPAALSAPRRPSPTRRRVRTLEVRRRLPTWRRRLVWVLVGEEDAADFVGPKPVDLDLDLAVIAVDSGVRCADAASSGEVGLWVPAFDERERTVRSRRVGGRPGSVSIRLRAPSTPRATRRRGRRSGAVGLCWCAVAAERGKAVHHSGGVRGGLARRSGPAASDPCPVTRSVGPSRLAGARAVPAGRSDTVRGAALARADGPLFPTARSHAYSLLRAILGTAVSDDVIGANPCRVRGAGSVRRASITTVLTASALADLASRMPEPLDLAVRLAGWCALRVGEFTELRASDLNLTTGKVHRQRVSQQRRRARRRHPGHVQRVGHRAPDAVQSDHRQAGVPAQPPEPV